MDTKARIKETLELEHNNPETSPTFPDIDKEVEVVYGNIMARLRSEIKKEPYQDKTPEAIFEIIDGTKTGYILEQVAYAPNALTIDDIKEALNG